MSTSAISSNPGQHIHQYLHERGADLGQLGQALTSGDLTQAQTAFNNIVSLGQSNNSFANGDPFKLTNREQDFNAVGQALKSGDLSAARQAFGALVDAIKTGQVTNSGGGFKSAPPTATSTGSAGPDIVLNLTNTGTAANPEQITINLGPTSNGGAEQISISEGTQTSPHAQQITLNLNPSNNINIELNLLNASSSTSTSTASDTTANGGISVTA